jgi:hypothetical protein
MNLFYSLCIFVASVLTQGAEVAQEDHTVSDLGWVSRCFGIRNPTESTEIPNDTISGVFSEEACKEKSQFIPFSEFGIFTPEVHDLNPSAPFNSQGIEWIQQFERMNKLPGKPISIADFGIIPSTPQSDPFASS